VDPVKLVPFPITVFAVNQRIPLTGDPVALIGHPDGSPRLVVDTDTEVHGYFVHRHAVPYRGEVDVPAGEELLGIVPDNRGGDIGIAVTASLDQRPDRSYRAPVASALRRLL
jgi:hypothetical protein